MARPSGSASTGVSRSLCGRGLFGPRIIELTPGREFAWLGRLGLPGVFDGRHRLVVEHLGEGRSRLVHSERLSGALVLLFRRMLTIDTPATFSHLTTELAAGVAVA